MMCSPSGALYETCAVLVIPFLPSRLHIFLSTFFVGLTLFTGRQSARTLILELQHASDLLGSKTGNSLTRDA
jgi:hypothetical protein